MFHPVWHQRTRPAAGRRSSASRWRPVLEALEDRLLLSTFTVTDLGDAGIGSGLQGDLRYAIDTANANDEPSNQIVFQPGLAGTIALTQGPLAIRKDLEINGPGQDVLTVSGSHQSGVLDITDDPQVQAVTISGLTVADGTGVTVNGTNVGGGVYNDHADLTLSRCTVTGNAVTDFGDGGGIYNNTGTLTVISSTVAGNVAGNGNAGQGGGIYNALGTLILASTTVSDNTTGGSIGGDGGGIYSSAFLLVGSVTISSSVIADNQTGSVGSGGGLWLGGPVTITDSTITGNTAGNGGAGGISLLGALPGPIVATISDSAIVGNTGTGLENTNDSLTIAGTSVSGNSLNSSTPGGAGGIYNAGRLTMTTSVVANNAGAGIVTFDQLTLNRSTVAGNSLGGGLVVSGGDAEVVNSTLTGNSAAQGAGGIAVMPRGFVELLSVTITGNAATGTGRFNGGGGLSVTNQFGSGRAVLRNTLVAGNSTATTGPDVDGSVTSLGYNLVGEVDDSQGWGPHDLTGTLATPLDPVLGPLQDNGGPTPTHALLAGSPAINHGDPALQFSLDQRGTVRFHSGANPPVDMGAFDANFINGFRIVTPAEVTAGASFPITVIALDGSGNTASTFLGRIHFSSTDPAAVLPPDYTFSPSDGGMASFLVTLQTTGSQQLRVDTVSPPDYRGTASVLVDPAPAWVAAIAGAFTGEADPAGFGLLAPGPQRHPHLWR